MIALMATGLISILVLAVAAMLAILETVWLQLGPTMRALYSRLRRNEPPHHHRMILAALRAGDEPALRLGRAAG